MTEGLTTDLNMDLTTDDLTTDSTTTDSLSAAVEVRFFSIYMLISLSKNPPYRLNKLSREPCTFCGENISGPNSNKTKSGIYRR